MNKLKLAFSASLAALCVACSNPAADLAALQAQAQAASGLPAIAPVDEQSFAEADLIGMAVRRDFAGLQARGLYAITYLQSLSETIEDRNNWMRVPGIFREVDPTVSRRLAWKATSPQIMDDVFEGGLQTIGNVFEVMGRVRQSGGSMGEEMSAILDGMRGGGTSISGLGSAQANGIRDGQVMLDAFMVSPEMFRAVYGGITDFANS